MTKIETYNNLLRQLKEWEPSYQTRTLRVGVTGSRSLSSQGDRDLCFHILEGARIAWGDFELVAGECPEGGPDIHAKEWAEWRRMPYRPFPPARRTTAAYLARNRELVDYADVLLGFWDGRNPHRGGTTYTMRYAHRQGKRVFDVLAEIQGRPEFMP